MQVGKRQPAPRGAKHRQPGRTIARVQKRERQSQQVLNHGSGAELIDRYASQSDRDLSFIDWYIVMACFKLAIILEGTFARAQAGLDPAATGERLHTAAVRLCERALGRIG